MLGYLKITNMKSYLKRLYSFSWLPFIVIMGCSESIVTHEEVIKKESDSIIIEDDADLLQNKNLTFYPSSPDKFSKDAVRFYIFKSSLNWESEADYSIKPKTPNNPDGIDNENLDYGDFGNREFTFRKPFYDTQSLTFDYFALNGKSISSLSIDSIEVSASFSEDGSVRYSGYHIGYGENLTSPVWFIIETDETDFLDIAKIHSFEAKDLWIDLNPEKPDELGFYDGPYILNLNYLDTTYNTYSNEGRLLPQQSFILDVPGHSKQLFSSWADAGALCEYYFTVYVLYNQKLKETVSNEINCDI